MRLIFYNNLCGWLYNVALLVNYLLTASEPHLLVTRCGLGWTQRVNAQKRIFFASIYCFVFYGVILPNILI